MEPTPRARNVAAVAAAVVLAALTVLSLWSVSPPSPLGADAPADEFSAARAFTHVERIAQRVHVTGGDANADVRSYVESTLRGYGLQPEVQDGVGATDALGTSFGMARVRNVVAVLPGTASSGRLFLVAHYDSVQVSYGANDDGAGVSTLLETARVLTQGERPRNDIVFVFTDAEEACLCGAEAFVTDHPLARDGGVVLNFEARGSGGPVVMFETSSGNADLISLYGDVVPYPVATSFAVEVYRILPNDTDFTPFRTSTRFTGLNAAYIDGSAAYHTPQDRPSYMDKSSLQHHGANALALARALGGADLAALSKESAGDATYFPALNFLVRYPGSLVWPIAGLALAAVLVLAFLARRKGLTSWPRIAAGFGTALVPLVAAPVVAQLIWWLLTLIRPGYRDMIDPWQPGWFRIAVVASVAAVVLTWFGLLRRRIGAWSLGIGGLAWLALFGVLFAWAVPGGSYLAAVPALAGSIAAAVAVSLRNRVAGIAVLTAGAAVAILVLAPTILLFFPALGLAVGGVGALFAVMLSFALLPAADWAYPSAVAAKGSPVEPPPATEPASATEPAPSATGPSSASTDGPSASAAGPSSGPVPGPSAPGPRRRLRSAVPAGAAAVLLVVSLVVGLLVDRFDAIHPAPTSLMYALNADTGQARWVSSESSPSDWTSQYVTGRENLGKTFQILGDDELATGPAQAASLTPPRVAVESDDVSGGERSITVRLTPTRPVRLIYLSTPEGVNVVAASAEGKPVQLARSDGETEGPIGITFHSPPAEGISITLRLRTTGQVTLRVMDGSDGLNNLPGFVPRPADVGIEGSHDSELVLVAKTFTV